jgi:ribose/xylose/arabinose/galactoside ABC-type transport system permease subunit
MSNNQIKKFSINLLKGYGIFILVIIAVGILTIFHPSFLNIENIVNLSQQIVLIGILGLGVLFVLISGGLDISLGTGMSFGSIIIGVMVYFKQSLIVAIILMVVSLLSVGAINGFIISKLKVGPIIVTLAMMTIMQGLTYLLAQGRYIKVTQYSFFDYLGRGRILGIPVLFIILVVLLFISYVILNHTKIGLYLQAIGSNEAAAKAVGINIVKWKFIAYFISAIFMCIGAIVVIGRVLLVTPEISGFALLFDAIAAAFLGGVSLTGGKGSVSNIIVGSIIIVLLNNATQMLQIDPAWNGFFKGSVIIIAIIFTKYIGAVKQNNAA